jgi:uncharacterized protein involved in response to NO
MWTDFRPRSSALMVGLVILWIATVILARCTGA